MRGFTHDKCACPSRVGVDRHWPRVKHHHDDSKDAPLDAVPLQLGVDCGHSAAAVQGHKAQRLELCGADGPPGGQRMAGRHNDDHLILQPGGHLRLRTEAEVPGGSGYE